MHFLLNNKSASGQQGGAALVVALLVYMIYANLLSLVQAWVSQGKLPFYLGVWVVHAGAAAVLALMMWRRMSQRRLFPARSGRRAAVSTGAAVPAADS